MKVATVPVINLTIGLCFRSVCSQAVINGGSLKRTIEAKELLEAQPREITASWVLHNLRKCITRLNTLSSVNVSYMRQLFCKIQSSSSEVRRMCRTFLLNHQFLLLDVAIFGIISFKRFRGLPLSFHREECQFLFLPNIEENP